MKRLLLTVFTAFFAYAAATAQLAGIVVESANDGSIGSCATGTQPAGTTTYRIYAELEDPTDFLVGVSANLGAVDGVPFSCHPIDVSTTTTFFNTPAGASIGDNINAAVFCAFVFDLGYDTWVTIGNQDNSGSGTNSSWTDPADPISGPCGTTGASLTAEDGAWYALPGAANGFGVGPNNRVLLGQFTTDGDFSFNLNVSVLDEGVGGTNMFYAWNNNGGCVNGLNYQDATGLGLTFPSAAVPGCTDATACNYDAAATEDDASCEFTSCVGCTDDTACNYDATATIDDASCTFPEAGLDCNGDCLAGSTLVINIIADEYPGENTWSLFEDLVEIAFGDGTTQTQTFCIDESKCYQFVMEDSFGDGQDGSAFGGVDGSTSITLNGTEVFTSTGNWGDSITGDLTACAIGCTDATACNYDDTATLDDASCDFSCYGCTDATAANYDPAATIDDGSCSFLGCTDATACNYNENATTDDGSCLPNTLTINMTDSYGDGWNGNTYEIYDLSDPLNPVLVASGDIDNAQTTGTGGTGGGINSGTDEVCLADGCYSFVIVAGGQFINETGWSLSGANETLSGSGSASENNFSIGAGSCPVFGCVDATACNYDDTADTDDGSCEFTSCAGCTDATALNYDDTATIADAAACIFAPCVDAPQNFVYCYDTGSVSFTYEEFVVGEGVVVSINEGTFETCCDELMIYDGANNTAPVLYDGTGVFDVSGVIAQSTGAFITIEFNGDGSVDCTSGARVATDYDVYCAKIFGCTDDTAANYNAEANTDDGSCSFLGCTDATACNYSANATTDDGSCEFTSCAGCTDASAVNYDATATIDDASCIVPGCNDAPFNFTYCYTNNESSVFTYEELEAGSGVIVVFNEGNMEACCDDMTVYDGSDNTAPVIGTYTGDLSGLILQSTGSAITIELFSDVSWSCEIPVGFIPVTWDYDVYCGTIFGCTDDTAGNYDAEALTDDGSCQFGVAGCTDVTACNYDAAATVDDGTCTFAQAGQDCAGNCLVGSTLAINIIADEYPGENTWTLFEDLVEIAFGDGTTQTQTFCIDESKCYQFVMEDSFGDGQDGSAFGGVDGSTSITLNGTEIFTSTGDWGESISHEFGTCAITGCTDPAAINYNADATEDDGSCILTTLNETPGLATPLSLNVATGPGAGCNGLSGENMAAAQVISVDGVYRQTNPDLWYSFVPFSSGNRIQVQTEDFDALIEVFDADMNLVMGADGLMYEDDNFVDGTEIFHAGDLTAGNTYYIRVAPYFSVTGEALFDICVQTFRDTRCDYGPGPYSLCQLFKADFVYSDDYIFNFTSQTTQETYSSAPQSSTFLQLSNVDGLLFGDDYDVAIESVYYVTDGAGNEEMVVCANDEPCSMILSTPDTIALRDQDNSVNHGPHFPGNYIRANSYVCNADRYQWKFTRTDVPELPVEYTTNTTSTYVRISDVLGPDAADGGVYDVQVQPVFDSSQSIGYGDVQEITIIGVAGIQGDVLTAAPQVEETGALKLDENLTDAMVYPNPSTGENITINLSNIDPSAEQGVITVTDFVGRTVASFQITLSGSNHQEVINLNNLSSGTYLMNINVNGEMMTEKIVIAK